VWGRDNVIKDVINGAEALLDGFGKAPPPQEVAQARADVCLHSGKDGTHCPHNHVGKWSATAEVGRVIQAQREKKLHLKLRVDGEEGLGICKICSCPVFLKVFYDWQTIYGHTTDEQFAAFRSKWPACWMIKELDNHEPKPQ
jgi:hypothetical protein